MVKFFFFQSNAVALGYVPTLLYSGQILVSLKFQSSFSDETRERLGALKIIHDGSVFCQCRVLRFYYFFLKRGFILSSNQFVGIQV